MPTRTPIAPSSVDPADDETSSHIATIGHAIAASWALLVGIGLLMLGTGLQSSLLGVRASLEGFDTTTTGIVMSSYYLGYLLGSIRAPHLVATVGHIRVFAAFASLASSAVLIHVLFVNPFAWSLTRMISGFCMAGLFVVAESWLNDGATNETRGSLLSVYMVVANGAMAAGQLLLNAADPLGSKLFITISVLVSLALVPAALSVRANPRFLQPVPVTLREVFHAAPLGVVGALLAGTATGALFGVGVVYAQLAALSLAETSVFMLVAILGGALLQWPIGAASDRTDRRRVIAASALGAAVVCAIGTIGFHDLALFGLIGVVGGLSIPLYPLANAHTNDFIEPEQVVGAGSRLVLASGLGAITGPFLASSAMAALGAAGFFWFLAMVHLLIAGFAVYRITRRAPVPVDEQSHYAVFPAESSVLVSTLNPEVWDEDDEPVFEHTGEMPVVVVGE
ncbi:MAG: MFS transporter [Acidimicrobiia bacterium]|nr:MFS transporter [Acidimicrobiia bacterium]